jgi:PAS domain S-box-containing protein
MTLPIGLPPELFAAAFPFHVAIDRSFAIRQFGKSLGPLCHGLTEGCRFFDIFQIQRPGILANFEALLDALDELFVLEVRATHVKLRGQMVLVPASSMVLFLGSPWVTDPTEIGQLGLSLRSFALHDATVDLLMVMQAQNAAFQDTRRLADRLQAEAEARRATGEHLQEREETLQTFLESASEAIVMVSENGLIDRVNARTVSMFGYSREELLGQPIERLVPRHFAESHVQHRTDFLQYPRNRPMGTSMDLVAQRKDGVVFPVDISLSYVRTGHGLLAVGFIADLTERKRIEEALATARDQAIEASRLKSEFLATMSHEIRTPMNSILGLADLLLESGLNEEQAKLAGLVSGAGRALLGILNDILDNSKIEAGKLQLELVDFNLRSEVDLVVTLLATKASEKDVDLLSNVDPSLPHHVRGDAGRLRQVLMNLLSNAVKFTQRGGVTLSVSVEGPGLVRFEVQDTGIGLSEEAKARLFLPFSQGDRSIARKYGGTGLGLAISAKLVELMGGTIGVRSVEGHGSTFWFVVPLEAISKTAQRAPSDRPASLRVSGGAPRILLAEDNDVNSMIALKMLERMGYSADRAATGREVVEAVKHTSYQLVLMDCQMPEMDGFEATRIIRASEQSPRLAIVAMTASVMEEDRNRCLAAGMDGFLSKPVDRRELGAVVERWLCAPPRL